MNLTFGKEYKLKSKKSIEFLFKEGKWISSYPLKIVYTPEFNKKQKNFKCGVVVPKRLFKKAVDRNKIKRKLREVIRHNKEIINKKVGESSIFMLVYSSNNEENLKTLKSKFEKLLNKL